MQGWDDVRIFLALHRERTLAGAAARVGLDASTLSRRLAALEESLGARLFDRTREGLVPTDGAERLLAAAEEMASAHARFSRDASAFEREAEGVVRLSVPPGVADAFVAPALVRLRKKHPRIRIELDASVRYVDLTRREADLAIRTTRPQSGDLVVLKLAEQRWTPMVSAARAKKMAPVASWGELDWIAWGEELGHLPPAQWLRRHAERAEIRPPHEPFRGAHRRRRGRPRRGAAPRDLHARREGRARAVGEVARAERRRAPAERVLARGPPRAPRRAARGGGLVLSGRGARKSHAPTLTLMTVTITVGASRGELMEARSIWARALDVAGMVATPLVPSHYVELFDPLRTTHVRHARVVSVLRETERTRTLTLKPGHGWRAHRAGQFVKVSVDVDGRLLGRTYSLSSSPDRDDGLVTITVTAMGRVSNALVHATRPGDYVRIGLPQGDFTLPDEVPARLLFVTGGSGVTPVRSMLRTLALRRAMPDVVHLHYARSEADAIFGAELRQLARDFPSYRFEPRYSTEPVFGAAALAEIAPDFRGRAAWACGPESLLDAVGALLPGARRRALPREARACRAERLRRPRPLREEQA